MAPNSKPRKKCFFSGGCCFGSFKNHKLVKTEKNMSSDTRYDDGSKKPRRSNETAHVDVLSLQKTSCYSKQVESEVEVIKTDDHKLPTPENQNIVNNYKDMILDSTLQEAWSGPIKLSHSVSMPIPSRKNKKVTVGGGGVKEKQGKELIAGTREIDPIVGALILTVTLIVMLVWGKVSAILCTAIWFYCIPRLIRPDHFPDSYGTRIGNGSNPSDLYSLENKERWFC